MTGDRKKPDLEGKDLDEKDLDALRRIKAKYGRESVERALALIDKLPLKRAGAPIKWDAFRLMVLAAQVRSVRINQPDLSIEAACELVSRISSVFRGSKGATVRLYYQAEKLWKDKPESLDEVELFAEELANFRRGKAQKIG